MSTKADKERRQYTSAGSVQELESAPSEMRADEARIARTVGLVGLVAFLIGTDWVCWAIFDRSLTQWLLKALTKSSAIDSLKTVVGSVCFAGGLLAMRFHALSEKDQQLRRTYGLFGMVWLVVSIVCMVLPLFSTMESFKWAAHLFLPGWGAMGTGLAFLRAFIRNETDEDWKRLTLLILGGIGAATAIVGFLAGTISTTFLMPSGLLLAVLGLVYLWTFIQGWGDRDDIAEFVAVGTALGGALFFLVALIRSLLPLIPWFKSGPYLIPGGFLLMAVGLLYVGVYALFRMEWRFLAMVRRELSSFFYSPVAYLVLIGFTLVAWICFWIFLNNVVRMQEQGQPLFEPIVQSFFLAWFPIISILFIVPALTMRSLSEEQRTGTMEVLLTAPVSEASVVLSKFAGTLIFYMILWVPWLLFLVAVRIAAGIDFDIRPLLSFLVAVLCSGAGFVAMGMFFSSLTRNQVIAAVLTFAGMFGLLVVFFLSPQAGSFQPVVKHTSFVELWLSSLDGKLQLNFLIFHISVAVLWLFLTTKLLEARKWS